MSSPGDDKTCPMCGESVGLGNDLQLHYLTRCKGYDKKDDGFDSRLDPTTGKASLQREGRRKSPDSRASLDDGRLPGETSDASVTRQHATYLVTFLWRPMTPLSFKKVTLLSHFTVEMRLDAQRGCYISDPVEASEGEFDGQVVFGHSYCYALKKFVVDKSSSVVLLELDVSKMTESEPEDTATGSYYYTTYASDAHGGSSGISLQSNPAYGYSQGPYANSVMAGEVYSPHGMHYMYEGETHSHYHQYGQHEDHSAPREDEFLPGLDDGRDDDSYSQKLSEEGFAPATVKSKTVSRQRVPSSTSKKYQDSGYTTSGTYYSPAYKSSYSSSSMDTHIPHSSSSSYSYQRGVGASGGSKYGTGTSPIATSPANDITINPLRTKNIPPIFASESTVGSTLASTTSQRPTPPVARETSGPSGKAPVAGDAFAVSEVQSDEADPRLLKAELEQVTRERDSLKQSLERVSAQWEGKVKRLQDKLRQQGQEAGGDGSADILADMEEIDKLQAQLEEARDELNTKEVILADKEKELSETKDRVTALEDQLIEYATTIQEQTKSMMSVQSRYSTFTETIAMLERKVSRVEVLEAESATLQQTMQILTSDLKDNQQLIRQLTATIREKEDDIRHLQQQRHRGDSPGRHAEALELETMRQKQEAWMKRAEDLTGENEILKREIRKLEEEQDSANATAETLRHQLRSSQEECAAKQADRDVLEARFTELQEVRMQQERDLTMLRSERAEILQQSAELSEASKPEKYQRLKKENSQLQKQHKELVTQLEEAQRLIKIHQDKNVELQRMLEEASNPAKLRAIEQKMAKYKQEREQAKEELRSRQATEEEWRQKDQEQLKELELNRIELSRFAVKLEATESKRKRYKQECRQLQQLLDSMHLQLEDKEMEVVSLQSRIKELTISQQQVVDGNFSAEDGENLASSYGDGEGGLVDSPELAGYPDAPLALLSYNQDGFVSSEPNLSTRGGAFREPSWSSRQRWSGDHRPGLAATAGSKSKPRQSQTSVIASVPTRSSSLTQTQPPLRSYDDLSPEERDPGFPVITAKGVVSMELRKPPGNVKKNTRVVVKRDKGDLVMGTLMYVGKPDRKELAGVVLDVERTDLSLSTSHDGTFKNGERYFQCPPGYGLYTTLNNIFVPVHQL